MKYYIKLKDTKRGVPEEQQTLYLMLKKDFGKLFEYDIDKIKQVTSYNDKQVKNIMRKLADSGTLELINEDTYLKVANALKLNEKAKVKETIVRQDIVARIKSYTANESLQQTLIDFKEMREHSKKPLTLRALDIILNKLDTWCVSDYEKQKIIETSIEHSWQTVYQPKGKTNICRDKSDIVARLDQIAYDGLLLVEQDKQDGLAYAVEMAKDINYKSDLEIAKANRESKV